jgi:hypothetical protein
MCGLGTRNRNMNMTRNSFDNLDWTMRLTPIIPQAPLLVLWQHLVKALDLSLWIMFDAVVLNRD